MVSHRINIYVIAVLSLATALIVADDSKVSRPPCPSGCSCANALSINCGIAYQGSAYPSLDNATAADQLLEVTLIGCGRYLTNVSAIPYKSATHLTIDNCGLGPSIVSGSFAHLSLVRELYVMGNKHLTTLNVGVFNGLLKLESLDLNGNDLNVLPAGLFSGLGSLKSLDLSYNRRLGNFPANLFGLSNLPEFKTLVCNACGLKDMPVELFAQITGLNRLELNENNFTDADLSRSGRHPFQVLSRLVQLSIDQSSLSVLAVDSFAGLEATLETLRLGHNRIGRIQVGTVSRLQNLTRLEIDHNMITVLDQAALPEKLLRTNDSSAQPSMRLGRNPWSCDGKHVSLLWLKKLLDSGMIITDIDDVMCSTPENLNGMPLQYVHEKTLNGIDTNCNESYSSGSVVVALVFSLLCLLVVSVAFVYRYCANRRRHSSPSRYGNVTLYSRPSKAEDDA